MFITKTQSIFYFPLIRGDKGGYKKYGINPLNLPCRDCVIIQRDIIARPERIHRLGTDCHSECSEESI